jgi:hypothetical protein
MERPVCDGMLIWAYLALRSYPARSIFLDAVSYLPTVVVVMKDLFSSGFLLGDARSVPNVIGCMSTVCWSPRE